ncbi:MAG: phenylacetate-CoA oxygenase subunit PaaI [Chloroflexi bacterium]|nr:phenylacetate-CoA oxygenase subunit PaaI [Chloroflexota bacterium]
MHAVAWIQRLASGGPDARSRLEAALAEVGPDAATVFTPIAAEAELVDAAILGRSLVAAEAAWRADLTSILVPLGLALPPHVELDGPARGDSFGPGRLGHSEAFTWLWGEFTSVRRSDPGAIW